MVRIYTTCTQPNVVYILHSESALSLSLSPSFSFSVALTISISFSVAFFLCLCDFQSFFLFYMAVHFACRVLCSNAALESKSNICYSLSSVLLLTRYCCRCGLVLIFFFNLLSKCVVFVFICDFRAVWLRKRAAASKKKIIITKVINLYGIFVFFWDLKCDGSYFCGFEQS